MRKNACPRIARQPCPVVTHGRQRLFTRCQSSSVTPKPYTLYPKQRLLTRCQSSSVTHGGQRLLTSMSRLRCMPPSIPNPKPYTLYPIPSTLTSMSRLRCMSPSIPNPKPYTLYPTSQTLNPKPRPHILNLEPSDQYDNLCASSPPCTLNSTP